MVLSTRNDVAAALPWGFALTGNPTEESLAPDEARQVIATWEEALERGDREAATRAIARLGRAGWFREPGAPEPQSRPAAPAAAPAEPEAVSGGEAFPAAGTPPAPVAEGSRELVAVADAEPAEGKASRKRRPKPDLPPPAGAVELHREARALAYVPLPAVVVPPEVRRIPGTPGVPTPWGELPALEMEEVAAAWVGRLLGELRNLTEAVSAQRSRLKAAVDDAADYAVVKIAGVRAALEEAYGDTLKAWTAAHCRGKRRHVDLLSVRLQLRASGGEPDWIADPNEERALVNFAEEHAGLDYVRREPRLERGRFKEWLKSHNARPGIGERAFVDLVDEATGEVREVLVPGVRFSPRVDTLDVKTTGVALAAPEPKED